MFSMIVSVTKQDVHLLPLFATCCGLEACRLGHPNRGQTQATPAPLFQPPQSSCVLVTEPLYLKPEVISINEMKC